MAMREFVSCEFLLESMEKKKILREEDEEGLLFVERSKNVSPRRGIEFKIKEK